MSDLIFDGPGMLQLEPDGKVYEPGDVMPHSLSHARRVQLQETGLRFTSRHEESVVTPDGTPAEMAAAEQIDPPAGAPAVVAAVEDMPQADEQPAPRASRKGN